jgi:hypothetical protein
MFSISTTPRNEAAEASAPVVSESEVAVSEVKVPVVKTYKVNGKDVQVSEDQFDKYIQLGMASTEKFQEAKRIQEEAQKVLALKGEKSAMKTLLAQGYTKQEAREILENDLRSEYEAEEEDAKLSPEAKKLREREAELAEYKAQEKARKDAIEAEAASREEREYLNKLDDEIAAAIEGSDLPKHPILGKMAINYMSSFASQGQELSAKEAMKYVNDDFKVIIRDVLSGMDAKAVKQYLKEDHIKGLRDDAMSEYQSKQKPFDKPAAASKQVEASADANQVANSMIKGRDFWAKKKGW